MSERQTGPAAQHQVDGAALAHDQKLQASDNVPPALPPFIKWAGGKRYLAEQILQVFPRQYGSYFEPFLGGGAVFLALRPGHAYLSDLNGELIECFSEVRDNLEEVISELAKLRNSKDDYYRTRSSRPTTTAARAARTIYLVQLAFNGIYRVHSKTGTFNVPYGRREQRVVYDASHLRCASRALQSATIEAKDFESATEHAVERDLVYMDPPYTVAHNHNGFVRYNQRLFDWKDQVRLADCAHQLVRRGCFVVISNAYHKSIRDLYPDFKRRRIERLSRMAAASAFRRTVLEYVLYSGNCCDN